MTRVMVGVTVSVDRFVARGMPLEKLPVVEVGQRTSLRFQVGV